MAQVTEAEAQTQLSSLLDAVEAGEAVVAIARGRLAIGDACRLMAHLKASLEQTTDLQDGSGESPAP